MYLYIHIHIHIHIPTHTQTHAHTHTHTHTNTHTAENSENLLLTGVLRSSVKDQSEVLDVFLLTRLAHSPD
jgi:hypothetical protein